MVKIIHLEEELNVSREEVKNIHLQKQLMASREQLGTCEEESAHYLESFYHVMRRLVDLKLQAQSEEIKKLNEEVDLYYI